jgi:hypothetical protein
MGQISYGKLSQLQKLILVALSEGRYAVMKRRAFNQLVKRRPNGSAPMNCFAAKTDCHGPSWQRNNDILSWLSKL